MLSTAFHTVSRPSHLTALGRKVDACKKLAARERRKCDTRTYQGLAERRLDQARQDLRLAKRSIYN